MDFSTFDPHAYCCVRQPNFYEMMTADVGAQMTKTLMKDVRCDDDKYEIRMDVHEFEPEELKVDIDGRVLTVSASHDVNDDTHGTDVHRSFKRRYTVPNDVDLGKMDCRVYCGRVLLSAPVTGKDRQGLDVEMKRNK